jgi:hypothetical protein
MTVDLLERAVATLGDVADDLVFVGGATIDVFVTEPGGSTTRPTIDVDVIAEVVTLAQYERLAERLRSRGLSEDSTSNVICRWRSNDDLILDVMPTSDKVFGFTNAWYELAIETAVQHRLPSDATIRVCHPSVLIATKLAAFQSRGATDPLTSADLDDIVRVIDGRPTIVEEVKTGPAAAGQYVATQLAALTASRLYSDTVRAMLLPDPGSQQRANDIVLPRMREIATFV